jgi:hypothetical protein
LGQNRANLGFLVFFWAFLWRFSYFLEFFFGFFFGAKRRVFFWAFFQNLKKNTGLNRQNSCAARPKTVGKIRKRKILLTQRAKKNIASSNSREARVDRNFDSLDKILSQSRSSILQK